MKKLVIACFFLVYATGSFAQDFFDLGIKAGMNVSKLSLDVNDYKTNAQKFNIGAFARLSLGRIYVQPEIYYSSKEGATLNNVGVSTINEFDLGVVNVPVLAGVHIIKKEAFKLRVMGGPVFSQVTSKKIDGSTFSKDNIKDSFVAWQYGAGIDFLMFTFDVRAESGGDDLTDLSNITNANANTFVLSLGFKFL